MWQLDARTQHYTSMWKITSTLCHNILSVDVNEFYFFRIYHKLKHVVTDRKPYAKTEQKKTKCVMNLYGTRWRKEMTKYTWTDSCALLS